MHPRIAAEEVPASRQMGAEITPDPAATELTSGVDEPEAITGELDPDAEAELAEESLARVG